MTVSREYLFVDTYFNTTLIPGGAFSNARPVYGSDEQGFSASSPGLPTSWSNTAYASASSVSGSEYLDTSGYTSLSRTIEPNGSVQVSESMSVTAQMSSNSYAYTYGWNISLWQEFIQIDSPESISLHYNLQGLEPLMVGSIALYAETLAGGDSLIFQTALPTSSGLYTAILEPGEYRLLAGQDGGLGSALGPFTDTNSLNLIVGFAAAPKSILRPPLAASRCCSAGSPWR